jgi:hypothetical protein
MKNFCLFLLIILGFLLSGCDYDTPPSLWDPAQKSPATPVILSVEPGDGALSGISKILIKGENFSATPGYNVVYFNKTEGQVIAESATQLTVIPPDIDGDSISIKVVVKTARQIASFSPYRLIKAYFDVIPGEQVYSMTMDRAENLYVHAKNKIINKITPDLQMTQYATTSFSKSSYMHMGPGGFLYLIKSDTKELYRIPANGTDELYVKLPGKLTVFDFDENGNVYSAGKRTGIMIVHPGGDISTSDQHKDDDVRALRIYNNYLYTAIVQDRVEIWRNPILSADGTLGEGALFFNWDNSGDFSPAEIFDITFSETGDLYVATNHNAGADVIDLTNAYDPILVIHTDGSVETLYPGVIKSPAVQLCWGNGNYLYVNRLASGRENSAVVRLVMMEKGAPYYGRLLE